MTPVETFEQHHNPKFEGDKINLSELKLAVRNVCEKRGILKINEVEDDQTAEFDVIFTVGQSIADSYPVVVIGHDASEMFAENWIDTQDRDNHLIVPDNHPEIIEEVKTEIERLREASKLSPASSGT